MNEKKAENKLRNISTSFWKVSLKVTLKNRIDFESLATPKIVKKLYCLIKSLYSRVLALT